MRYDGAPPLPHEPSRRLGARQRGRARLARPSRDEVDAPRQGRRDLMRGKYVIAGIGHTEFGRLAGRGTVSMKSRPAATRSPMRESRSRRSTRCSSRCRPRSIPSMYGQTLAEAMGLQPKVGGVWDQGGATNISMISFACMAIDAGQCDVAIVCLADDPKTGTRQAYEKAWGDDARLRLVQRRGRLCHDDAAPHGRVRHQARAVRRDRGRGAQSRRQQSARGAARAAHARQIHGVALHHRAAQARRHLPRLGRRRRRRGDEREARAGARREGAGARSSASGRGRLLRRAAPPGAHRDHGEGVRRDRVQDGGARAEGHRRRADLRLLHHRGDDDARGLRLLPQGRRRASGSKAGASRPAASCRSTPRAGCSPRPACRACSS